MFKTVVLVELARLELETAKILEDLDTASLDKQAHNLIRRADLEHKIRAEEIKREISLRPRVMNKNGEQLPEFCNAQRVSFPRDAEALTVAEMVEERLAKMHEMAVDIVQTPFIKDLAKEQHHLWAAFLELRRSRTLKMEAVCSEPMRES